MWKKLLSTKQFIKTKTKSSTIPNIIKNSSSTLKIYGIKSVVKKIIAVDRSTQFFFSLIEYITEEDKEEEEDKSDKAVDDGSQDEDSEKSDKA